MRAELKGLVSYDLPDARSAPDDPEDCCVGMRADIGPVGGDGADTFTFEVCTPRGLARRFDDEGRPFWSRGVLMVERFTWEAVEAALHQRVRAVEGRDWAEVAEKLNRFMLWEFEDYRP
jgi:Immunity protein 8